MITLFKGPCNDTALAGSRLVPSEEAARAGLSAASLSCALQEAGRCLPFTVLGAGRPRFPPSSPSNDGPGPEASLQAVGTAAPRAWPQPRAPWPRAPLPAGVSAGGHLVLSSVPCVQPWGHRRFGQALWTALYRPFLEKHLSVNTGLEGTFAISLDSCILSRRECHKY